MDGIQCTETHLFEGERQCLYCVGDLQMLRSKRQECKGLSTSCLIRNARDLIAQRLRIQQRKLFDLEGGGLAEDWQYESISWSR